MADNGSQQTQEAELPGVGDWVESFKRQRKNVEQGIRERLAKSDRVTRLDEADDALPDVDLPDFDLLLGIADRLEGKLQEILEVVLHGHSDNPNRSTRLPPGFDPGPDPASLRLTVAEHERLWLFRGGIMEILYRFRDQEKAFILKERNRLLKSLSARVRGLEKDIGELNAHPVVVQALNAGELQRVEVCLEEARSIASRYKDVLTSTEAGVVTLLEDGYYQLQGQFTATCALLCFQLYGNVSNEHLRDLLGLKAVHSKRSLIDVFLPSRPT